MSRDNPYERLALEYYDRRLHPTTANLTEASYLATRAWFVEHGLSGFAIDAGAGRSLLLRLVRELGLSPESMLLVDASPSMLRLSEELDGRAARFMVGTADDLPVADESVDFLLASLGDPYNDQAFWSEVRRVLRADGRALYTAPSWEWAREFRPLEGSNPDTALFVLSDGQRVESRSIILSPEAQRELVESAGLRVFERGDVPVGELPPGTHLSPKLDSVAGRNGPLVEWLVAGIA